MGRRAPQRGSTFDGFYRANARSLVALAWSLTGDREVAADLAQYALGEAAASWERVEQLERPDLWVRRVVVNRSATHFRTLERQRRTLVAVGPTPALDPQALSDATEEFLRLARGLPELQLRVVVLHYLEDRPLAEIADTLEVTQGTVKTSLHRARATLARQLRAESIADPSSDEQSSDGTTTGGTS